MSIATMAMASLLLGGAPNAVQMPPGISDPDEAITDPTYSDPVLFWRLTSVPENPFEPDPYFYWPNAIVEGDPQPFLPTANSGETTISNAALEQMAAWAEARDSTALIVIHKGKVQLERYWQGTEPDLLINGRAITRSVTPMLLGFAIADGALKLDDPIGKYLPEWADDQRGEVTVRHLAQNASGLEVAPTKPISEVLGNKDLCLAYCGDVVRAALQYDFAIPPGTRFEVAQENMQLLAIVIERAMGQPIQKLLSEHVWQPIGASDATFQFDRPGGTARAMCCMRATPRDWARLGVLIEQDGRWNGHQVLPAGWADYMATPSPANKNFGTGLWLGSPFVAKRTYFEGTPGVIPQSEAFLADDVMMMEGGGFRIVHMVPSQDLVIFRHGGFVDNWDTAFLTNTALRSIQK